jgi:hypothetical protein
VQSISLICTSFFASAAACSSRRREAGIVVGNVPSNPTRLPVLTANSIIGRSICSIGVFTIVRANSTARFNDEQASIIRSTTYYYRL